MSKRGKQQIETASSAAAKTPVNKKPKTETLSVISPELLTSESRLKLKQEHDESVPYRHLVLSPLCNFAHMKNVHEEIVHNLDGNLKETDLYKLYQTTEMGRIKSDNAQNRKLLKNLLELREALYSQEFRTFVQDITGCGELTDRTDCSCNAYSGGCHLLCHDDVIGTRCISYIIYVTDPDSEWSEADGGGLELYPLDPSSITKCVIDHVELTQGIPESVPTRTILPKFNTMAMFQVQPGRSYHSVQEVFTTVKPRISISGWYHTKNPPLGSDNASLSQILRKGDDQRPFTAFQLYATPTSSAATVVKSKKSKAKSASTAYSIQQDPVAYNHLCNFINPMYLSDTAIKAINKEFIRDSSIQLQDFLLQYIQDRIKILGEQEDAVQLLGNKQIPVSYTVGCEDVAVSSKDANKKNKVNKSTTVSKENQWKLVGPPHKRRYLLYNDNSDNNNITEKKKVEQYINGITSLGELLHFINKSLFECNIFTQYYLPLITTFRITHYRNEVRRFRPGLDYTVAHFGMLTDVPKLDCTLCFAHEEKDADDLDSEEEMEDNSWESGNVGGFECYIASDENAQDVEASEVYQQADYSTAQKKTNKSSSGEEDENELLSISAGNNILSIVMRDQHVMKFIKYINIAAPGSRWDITAEYEFDA